MSRLRSLLRTQLDSATSSATPQQAALRVAYPIEGNTQQPISNHEANTRAHPQAEDRRRRITELTHHLRAYAARNGFSRADFDEAMQVATAGDLEGWLTYIRLENERHGATVH